LEMFVRLNLISFCLQILWTFRVKVLIQENTYTKSLSYSTSLKNSVYVWRGMIWLGLCSLSLALGTLELVFTLLSIGVKPFLIRMKSLRDCVTWSLEPGGMARKPVSPPDVILDNLSLLWFICTIWRKMVIVPIWEDCKRKEAYIEQCLSTS
jgi:hypothetical protein